MSVDALFFDMGGTLVDFHGGELSDVEKESIGRDRLLMKFASEFPDVSFVEFEAAVLVPFVRYERETRKNLLIEFRIVDAVFEFFARRKILLDDRSIVGLLSDWYSGFSENAIMNDGVLECLEHCKRTGKTIGIVSNASLPEAVYLRVLQTCGIDRYVDFHVFSYANVLMKPDKSMFIEALRAARVLPGSAMMIGDNQRVDLETPRKLGMKTCFFNKKGAALTVESDLVVSGFRELLNVVL